MDSSARASDREQLFQRIIAADSILLLYDVTRPETFENLTNEWLPMLRDVQEVQNSKNIGQNNVKAPFLSSASNQKDITAAQYNSLRAYKPVVIVGTKDDLLVNGEDKEKYNSVLSLFPFVLVGLPCSAAKLQNVDQVFHYGEQAVTCPLHPLYDVILHEFTPACRRALQRIFRIFDVDNDNLLNDYELCDLQLKCFEASISDEELLAMKQHISNSGVGGLENQFFTFEGFLGLIDMKRDINSCQILWTILRSFHYDDDINLMVDGNLLAH